jgi:RNA recognition motif-containing protein
MLSESLYVGNVAWATTEDELSQCGAAYGLVAGVHLVRNHGSHHARGFDFVERPDTTEAQAAIAGLNGTSLGGRPLYRQ